MRSIIRFKQTDANMPSFIDVNSVIGMSHEVDGTKRTANIHMVGGGIIKIYYNETSIGSMRSVCDEIIKKKEDIENTKETERINNKKQHR